MKILIRGPLLSLSGYGNHARQVLEYVFEKHKDDEIFCDVTSWGNTSWNLSEEYLPKGIFDKIIDNFISEADLQSFIKTGKSYFDESYQICFPNEWEYNIAKKNFGFFAGIETTICCEKWLDNINLMDKVIVPSKHALNSIKNAAQHYCLPKIKANIQIIPEWFYDDFLHENNSNMHFLEKVKTDKNVLIIGQLNKINPETDRKNILKTLESTIEALEGTNCGVILKMFTENNSFIDFCKTKKIIRTYIDINFKNKDIPKIYLLHGNMKNNEIVSLYTDKKISCLVSGTRGEGFGLTFLEAAAAGIPIVATKWSAYDEFLEYYLEVDCTLKKIPSELYSTNSSFENYSKIWVEDSLWAEFDKKSMIQNIKKVIFNEYDKNSVLSQRKSILNKYSKNTIMSIYNKQFGR